MEENKTYRKKIGLYMLIALVIIALNSLAMYSLGLNDIPGDNKLLSTVIYVISNLAVIIPFFACGYMLTKNSKKTLAFAASLFLAVETVGIFTSLAYDILSILTEYTDFETTVTFNIIFGISICIIRIPIHMFIAYFAFRTFDGIGKKASGKTLYNSGVSRTKASVAFAVSLVISFVLSNLMSVSTLILDEFYYTITDRYSYETYYLIEDIVQTAAKLIIVLLPLLILYIVGFIISRKHVVALAFPALYYTAQYIQYIVSNLIYWPRSMITERILDLDDPDTIYIIYTLAYSLLLIIVTILIALFLFRFIFPKIKKTKAQPYMPPVAYGQPYAPATAYSPAAPAVSSIQTEDAETAEQQLQ